MRPFDSWQPSCLFPNACNILRLGMSPAPHECLALQRVVHGMLYKDKIKFDGFRGGKTKVAQLNHDDSSLHLVSQRLGPMATGGRAGG